MNTDCGGDDDDVAGNVRGETGQGVKRGEGEGGKGVKRGKRVERWEVERCWGTAERLKRYQGEMKHERQRAGGG